MLLQALFFALFGGMLPAMLWLWFWLKEDSAHPEPRGLIVITFLAGAAAVAAVIPFQKIAYAYFQNSELVLFFLWAALEEIFKFGAAYLFALRSKAVDEPIDMVIYMVTAALGFVAVENALFLLNPLLVGNVVDSIVTGNLRFVGASLLHVLCSSVVGLSLAFSYWNNNVARRFHLGMGLAIAIVLHTMFNLSIIDANGSDTFVTFSVLWVSVIGLLLFFEKIKKFSPVH